MSATFFSTSSCSLCVVVKVEGSPGSMAMAAAVGGGDRRSPRDGDGRKQTAI